MIKDRSKEVMLGVTLAIVIPLLMFALVGERLSLKPGITGFATYEDYEDSKDLVIVSGTEFRVLVDDVEFYYIFDGERWFESKREFEWELRKDMGDTVWTGLLYLESYDASIYYYDELVDDFVELAGKLR